MTLTQRIVVSATLLALMAGMLVYFDASHRAAAPAVARAAAPAVAPTPKVTLDSVRFKSSFLRNRDAVAAERARLRAEARARREAERARREAKRRARERAQRRTEAREARRLAQLQRPSGGLVVGDSVSLGAKSCLTPLGYRLDSEVGRQFTVGLQRIRIQASQGLPDTVVVHLGTNGPFGSDGFREVMGILGTERRVVWVTIALPDRSPYGFRDGLNEMIRGQAAEYPNVRVADFGEQALGHPEWFYGDGVHINSAGCRGFAGIVDGAVTDPVG